MKRGGRAARGGRNQLHGVARQKNKEKCNGFSRDERLLRNGVVRMESAGGGGYGDPLERDPELVRRDVVNEVLSLESASREYGVALNPKTLEVDYRATEELRTRFIHKERRTL